MTFLSQHDLQGDASFRNETRTYFCPRFGTVAYYNDMATLMFNTQEVAVKQLFHQNGKFIGKQPMNKPCYTTSKYYFFCCLIICRCLYASYPLYYVSHLFLYCLLDVWSRDSQRSFYSQPFDWCSLRKIRSHDLWVSYLKRLYLFTRLYLLAGTYITGDLISLDSLSTYTPVLML